ncbi:hypothetical protein [Desulfuromonas thiophila]|uniref:Uncharacterized protein n=1 Tax=Desulfuromonas thiophila TaxID=57664 RepID=A0A1G7B1V0_9BACT|nr:hypothetical protein [Desulfuromonas thiophila]SDE20900.1 hypothetical protein SAMN05661003_10517 [Desulfuromonas thiophila]
MSTPNYQKGAKAKAAIGTTTIKGLNSLTIPGVERNTIDVEEFDQDFDFTVPTSAKWTEGALAGNYVGNDSTGQTVLRQRLFDNEGLPNLRLYENESDFWAPDLANDDSSVIYVKGVAGTEVTKSGVIPFSATLLVQGLLARFDAHVSGATLAFTTTTITDSGSGFVTAGFSVGDTIIIEGSTSNDDVACIVTAVAAGTLTVTAKVRTLTAESALAGTRIHGGQIGVTE